MLRHGCYWGLKDSGSGVREGWRARVEVRPPSEEACAGRWGVGGFGGRGGWDLRRDGQRSWRWHRAGHGTGHGAGGRSVEAGGPPDAGLDLSGGEGVTLDGELMDDLELRRGFDGMEQRREEKNDLLDLALPRGGTQPRLHFSYSKKCGAAVGANSHGE